MLTALTALLAALAIIIGIVAVWGWGGMKEAAAQAAVQAVALRMKDLPSPERMLELASRMEDILGSWDAIQNKVVTDNDPNSVAQASNIRVKEETQVAPEYPGQGARDASSQPNSTNTPSTDDPRPGSG